MFFDQALTMSAFCVFTEMERLKPEAVQAIYRLVKFEGMEFEGDEMRYIAPTEAELGRICSELARRILIEENSRGKRTFDTLVTIEKGGLAFVRRMLDCLEIPEIVSFRLNFYIGPNERLSQPVLEKPLAVPLAGKKILVFDETDETGGTMKFTMNYLNCFAPAEVRTALLFHKPHSGFVPDYYGATTSAWIIFPNEPREMIGGIGQRWLDSGVEVDEIKGRFLTLGLSPDEVDFFMELEFSKK